MIESFSFVGRADELSLLSGALAAAPKGRGYLLVSGPPGIGKSALVARWVNIIDGDGTQPRPEYRATVTFKARVDVGDDAMVVESRLLADIRSEYSDLVEEIDVKGGLSGLLGAVSQLRLTSRRERIVVVVDGLDDVETGSLRELLPFDLPWGVFFVCTMRSVGHRLSWLDTLVLTHVNLGDLRWRDSNNVICESILNDAVSPPDTRERALKMGAGNALYSAFISAWRKISVECDELPYGLDGFYDMIWSRIKASGANRACVRTGLGLLAVARAPLPARVLARMARLPQRGVGQDVFLDTAGPLIVQHRSGGEIFYSLRHQTTREFIEGRLAAELHRFHGELAMALGWRQAEKGFCTEYAVRHMLFHLARARDAEAALRCGLDLSFVKACIELDASAKGVTALATDLQTLADASNGEEIVSEFHEVVREEATALASLPASAPMVLYNAMLARKRTESDIRGQFRFAERDMRLRLKWRHAGAAGRDLNGMEAVRALHGISQGPLMVASANTGLTPVRGLHGAGSMWLKAFVGDLSACALTPDGTGIVMAHRDGTLELRTLQYGDLRWKVANIHRQKKVSSCAVTPDGRYVLTASTDETMVSWRIADGRRGWVFRGNDALLALDVAADSHAVVTGADDGSLHLWSLGTGQLLRRFSGHRKRVQCCRISPDNLYLLSGSADRTAVVWDFKTGESLCTLSGHDGAVVSCAFGPDGRVFSVSEGGALTVWEWRTGKLVCTLPASRRFTCVRAEAEDVCVGDVTGAVLCFEMPDSTGTQIIENVPNHVLSTSPAVRPARAAPKPRRATEDRDAMKGSPRPSPSRRKCTVLLVSSSPDGEERLRVDREFRDVIAAMDASPHRNRFRFIQVQAARYEDLRKALFKYKPDVLHVCAHGEADGALLLEDEYGKPKPMTKKQFIGLLGNVEPLRLVVINACHSEAIARHLTGVAGLAIGMSERIADEAAIAFAVALYGTLGFKLPVEVAFKEASNSLGDGQGEIPQLFPSADQDPENRRKAPILKS